MSGTGSLITIAMRRAAAVAAGTAVLATGATAMQTAEQERRLQQRETVADLRSGDPERMGPALATLGSSYSASVSCSSDNDKFACWEAL